jgi:uracil-DNA glycosylase
MTLDEDYKKYVELLLGKWSTFLPSNISEIGITTYNRVNDLRKTYKIYPEQQDIFKVLKLVPPNKVKVVVLSQDPYYNGNATGVAFACKNSPSPSFKQIWNSIKLDTEKEYAGTVSLELNHLVEQGELLLNTILTVQEGQPLSHKYLQWEEFTAYIINALSLKRDNLVFMLWGSAAQRYSKYIGEGHLLLTEVHPQFATYKEREWNCNHFSKCNTYLKEHNIETIKWR